MKNKILEVLTLVRGNSLSLEEIYRKCGYSSVSLDDFQVLIDELIDELKITMTGTNKYSLNPYKEGIVFVKRNGDVGVAIDDYDVKIKDSASFKVYNKDRVLIKITDFNTFEGVIKEIIKRNSLVGEVVTFDNIKYVIIGNEKFLIDISNDVVDGTLIGVEIAKEKNGKYYHAFVDKILGHKNAPRIEEIVILYENGFPSEFSMEALKELEDIPSEVLDSDIEKRRDHDLRDKMIFTIDGDDTKDIDDAISLDILDNGNYVLGVHIADVSHYVKSGSELDKEAELRGTSVYMPGVVSPMYPPYLSNGICSLNPNVDRLALSCEMEFDVKGNLVDFDIFKSVIRSRKQMTYNNVNKILEEGIVPLGYEEYKDKIIEMKKLHDILDENRLKRGKLNFHSFEVKIETDIDGNVLDIGKRGQRIGEELIEYFMLAMNECLATYIYNMKLYSIYRVHDEPSYERLNQVLTILKSYGEKIDVSGNAKEPSYLQGILEAVAKTKNDDIYNTMILRCMAKAIYSTTNYGHYGLGIDSLKNEAYTHTTSPIRRYPDTMIHRIVTMILNGDVEMLSRSDYLDRLSTLAKHSSDREKAAESCEKEANKLKMAQYMNKFVGKEYDVRIVGFTKNGMFVQLSNLVEGRVGFETMNDYFNYVEEQEVIVGERSKKKYRLGDKLKVKLVRADVLAKEIDFEIIY